MREWRDAGRWSGDLAVVALLVGVLWYWTGHDGGLEIAAHQVVAVAAVLATPALWKEAARLPVAGRIAVAVWWLGLAAALLFAADRSNWVAPTLTYGTTPLVFLAARRVWRRPWGPAVLVGLLFAGAGRYWYRSFLQWWGGAEGDPAWLPLSWRNQSAVLMGMFGASFAGIAVLARRWIAFGAGLLAGASLAGAWLTGSRAGFAAAVLGSAASVLGAWRAGAGDPAGRKRFLVSAGGVVVVAVGLVVSLTAMTPGAGQPVAQRDQTVADNTAARLHHMAAAVGMFTDRPLTGFGPGAYREIAPAYTAAGANLVADAHNEYLEALAEGGVLFGAAFLLVHAMAGWLVLRGTARPREGGADTELSVALRVGAAGAVATLVLHAAVDFDWKYPILPALGAVLLALLCGRSSPRELGGWRRAWGATLMLPAMLVGGAVGAQQLLVAPAAPADASPSAFAASGVPWDAQAANTKAVRLLASGEPEAAAVVVDRARPWSPGNDRLRVLDATVSHALDELTTPRLVDEVVSDPPTWLSSYLTVGAHLADAGEQSAAETVLRAGLPRMESRRAWGGARLAADAQLLLVQLADGCPKKRQVAAEARSSIADAVPHFRSAIEDALARDCGASS